jgi:hypothetical protein
MAEPPPDPKPDAQPSTPDRRSRRGALLDAGLEAMSLAALAFVVVGFSAYGSRREISRELALAWLEDKGVEASLELDDLDATGFAGAIRLGPENAPVFSAERIEVAYDLTSPWSGSGSGGQFALKTRAIRLVRPRLDVGLDQNGLHFGALQSLIDEALKAPSDKTPGPAILIEDARVRLRMPGGVARLTGDASLDDGKLLRFDGRLGPMHYAAKDLSFDTDGVLVKARKRDDRLTLDANLDLRTLSAGGMDLTEAQGTLQADIAYPDLEKLSVAGPADMRLALRARGADLDSTALGDVEATFAVTGLLSGDLKRGGLTGHVSLHARGERLTAPALDGRDMVADLDLTSLALTYDPSGARGAARTRLAATAEKAVAGGAALSRAAIEINAPSLTAISDAHRRSVSGPMTVSLGGGRMAFGGVALSSVAASGRGRFSAGTDGLTAALDGQAGADGAVAGPDAERLAAVLPNPDYAKAAARALSRFELSAPSLRLATQDGQTSLYLARPVTFAAGTGAKATLSAAGGPLVAATAGGTASGRLALAVGGGGLPDLTLKAPDWRSGPDGVTSDVVLAGTFDMPPARGVSATLAGQARLSGDVFSFRLPRCTPVTARTWEMGEPPISQVKLDVCPTTEPLLRAAGGVWRASARLAGGEGLINVAEARAEGVAATFTGGGRGGFDEAQVRVTAARLVDAAAAKRFEPVTVTGAINLARGQWTGGFDAATPAGHALGRIGVRHDVAAERGEALIDASTLTFTKGGLQPAELTPLAQFAREAEGTAAFTGRFAWAGETMVSDGKVSTSALNFKSPLGFVATLQGQVAFTSLAPLTSAPDQTLKIARIDAIVPVQTVESAFTLGPEALHVQSTTLEAAKGRISIEPIDVPLDGKGVLKGVINIQHLDLGELVAGSSMADKVKVEAIVDGRLPFELGPAGFRFLDGKVYATQPGRVSIAREALTGVQAGQGTVDPSDPLTVKEAAPVNAIQDFAYQAMENLHFETLEAGVNSTDKGRLGVLFHIKGEHDPKVAEKAKVGLMELLNGSAFQRRIPLPAKTPVDLTLDTSLNFNELIAAAKRTWEEAQARATPSAAVEPPPAPRSDAVQP